LFLFVIDLAMTIKHRAHGKSLHDTVRGLSSTGSDVCNESNSPPSNDDLSLTHRMHLFSMHLLHFVNSLHDHIMTRVCLHIDSFTDLITDIAVFVFEICELASGWLHYKLLVRKCVNVMKIL